MSRKVTPFNRLEITSGVLDRVQDNKDELIANQLKDRILQPGIQVPAGTSASGIEAGLLTQFAISIVTNQVNIGQGVAYNAAGDRIEIPLGDSTAFNPNAPVFTAMIGAIPIQPAAGPIPYSTGSQNVLGAAGTNVDRFVFVQYLQVVRTVSYPGTPSNHYTPSGSVITLASGDSNAKKPLLELDGKTGLIWAPHRTDGYKVTVAALTDLSPSSQPVGETPILTADPTAIYIGRFSLDGGGNPTSPVLSDSDRPRLILQFRPVEVGTIQIGTDRPSTYATGEQKTLEEHVSATGSGTVTPVNPHALTLGDMGVTLPDVETVINETMGDGIVDLALSPNSPIPASEALDPQINATLKQVTFKQVAVGQTIYLNGRRYLKINTATSTSANDPVVIQFVSEGTGVYTIYGEASAIAGEMTLKKTGADLAAPANTLIIAKVYWYNPTLTLRKSLTRDSSSTAPQPISDDEETPIVRPVDLRQFGLITPQQLSTDFLSHPLNGARANQTTSNLLYNPDFWQVNSDLDYYGLTTIPVYWSIADIINTNVGGGSSSQYRADASIVADIFSSGPKTLYANRIRLPGPIAPGSNLLQTVLKGKVANLKPNTTYTLTGWIKATKRLDPTTKSDTTVAVLARLTDNGTHPATAAFTTMQDLLVDGSTLSWQRVRVTFTTNAAVTAITNTNLEIHFVNQGIAVPMGSPYIPADFYLTNFQLTEGNWVEQFTRPKLAYRWATSRYQIAHAGPFSSGVKVWWASAGTKSWERTITVRGGMFNVRLAATIQAVVTVLPVWRTFFAVILAVDGVTVDRKVMDVSTWTFNSYVIDVHESPFTCLATTYLTPGPHTVEFWYQFGLTASGGGPGGAEVLWYADDYTVMEVTEV
jgi:hypothetical protein